MLKSKIHRATVTGSDLHYVGSVSLDRRLMTMADLLEFEQVAIFDINNGARFETYVIGGSTGQVCLNGAAARLVHPGDHVIIVSYADLNDQELADYAPIIVHVDAGNQPQPISSGPGDNITSVAPSTGDFNR